MSNATIVVHVGEFIALNCNSKRSQTTNSSFLLQKIKEQIKPQASKRNKRSQQNKKQKTTEILHETES